RARARSELRWITGPSAIGSENGTPSSMQSAPAATSACITGTVASSEGSPAVMKGIRALRPSARRRAKAESMRLIAGAPGSARAGARGTGKTCRRRPASEFDAFARGDGVHVLVPTTGQVAQHQLVLRQLARQLDRLGHRMAGFQRRQDAFGPGQAMEGFQCLLVGDPDVLGTAAVLEESVLRADAGIVQAGGDRMGLGDLAVVVAGRGGAGAME